MAEADRLTIAGGTPGIVLMERAGRAVADVVADAWAGGPVLVLAGPGNNGGDGWVAARLLREAGFRVTVGVLGDRAALHGDAAPAASRFDGVVVEARPQLVGETGMIVDGLFGAGVRLPLDERAVALVEAINRSAAPVVAIDLPSGVEGGGGTLDPVAVKADATVTFFRLKPGHVLMPGRSHCGRVVLADIGIETAALEEIRPQTFLNRPALWQDERPAPRLGGHKYHRGHAVIVSGPPDATGAARLAAGAALRVGAGLVTLASPMEAVAVNAGHLTAVMVREADGPNGLAAFLGDRRLNAVVIGPGLGRGDRTRQMVEAALDGERSVVIDADGLTSFEAEPERLFQAIAGAGGDAILTPHDGEFARLFSGIDASSRLERARAAAKASGAVVLTKGADTIVADPGGRAAIADNAPPELATAGSGDVLAGLIGGLLAQGMPPFEAASAAVWIHGEAAYAVGAGLISEDIEGHVPTVLARLGRAAV